MLYLIYISGFVWLIPLTLFVPSVWRIWAGKPGVMDILLSPLAFISINQVGYCLRWAIFHGTIPAMSNDELTMWSGLYTLSTLSALSAVVAWLFARRVV